MSHGWVDDVFDFHERLLREDMDSLQRRIDYTERSLVLALNICDDDSSIDVSVVTPKQKAQRFREYLEKLRESLRQLLGIAR